MYLNLSTMLQETKRTFRIDIKLYAVVALAMLPACLNAQMPISSTVSNTTLTTGLYYNNSSITIDPVTDINPGAGQSVELYIGGCAQLNMSFATDKNYIVTTTPRINTYSPGASYSNCDVMQTIQYYDDLGRPAQTVQQKASPQGNDVIQPFEYDIYGREVKKYLPYALTSAAGNGNYRSAAIIEQKNFYNAPSAGVTPILNTAFAETSFEVSPLNRFKEQGFQGAAWQVGSGHTVRISYGTNAGGEIPKWLPYTGGATGGNFYPAGSLNVTTTLDENSRTTAEYKDTEGYVVCKKVEKDSGYTYTYYVYDDWGNLAYVIPPLPPGVSLPGNFSESSSTEFNTYMYGYHYDDRNRVVQKKIPGKDWEYMVYNKMDLVAATQDGVQRLKSPQEWTFTRYDGQGRVTQTGVWKHTGSAAGVNYHYDVQLAVNVSANHFDTYTGAGTYGYNEVSWPQSDILTYLTVNYYGRYDFPGKPSTYNPNLTGTKPYPEAATGSLTKILLDNGTYTGGMLWSVNYYDAKARPVQTISQHYKGGVLNTNNLDSVTMTYKDFTGELVKSVRTHRVGGSMVLQLTNEYTYDDIGGRKLKTTSAVTTPATGTETPKTISLLSYNEVGQLADKSLHGNTSGSFLQRISYGYNERGWLKTSTSPLFAMQLNYNEEGANQYNGNISKQYWGAPGNLGKNYVYTYDAMNRLTSGIATGSSNHETIGYDDLGNIKTLVRTGTAPANLDYNLYDGNQLKQVKNGVTTFRNYGIYDANGNAPSDGQGHNISYNILNLPRSVSVLNMSYVYDASGRKLQKVFSGITTDYVNGIEYENGVLQFVQSEEGRILNLTGTPNYEYSLKDHLGNARVTFDSSTGAVAKQTDEYYPFGLVSSQTGTMSPENKYLYNGKELQDGLGQYDYGARFYDPVIGRFTTIDRFAEKYSSMTGYQYGALNPISNIDINGDSVWVTHQKQNYLYENGKLYQNGAAYTGKVKGFLKDAVGALGDMARGKEGADMLSELQSSTNNFTIVETTGKNKFKADNQTKAYANQLLTNPSQAISLKALQGAGISLTGGSGGTIYWNTSGATLPTTNGGQSNSTTDLAHEMFHGLDANRGLEDDRTSNGVRNGEVQATYRENILRGQLGMPLRTHYKTQTDPSGAFVGGTGPSMIYLNAPLRPKGYKP